MEQQHSVLGIASTSISVIVGIFIILVYQYSIANDSIPNLFCLSPFVSLAALGLGIGGLIQKGRKKIFAILGTIFSAVVIICSSVISLVALFFIIVRTLD